MIRGVEILEDHEDWLARRLPREGSRDLPAADRVAHLLLALREDEPGFAMVANLGFSGASWRVRRGLPGWVRPALDAARGRAREPGL